MGSRVYLRHSSSSVVPRPVNYLLPSVLDVPKRKTVDQIISVPGEFLSNKVSFCEFIRKSLRNDNVTWLTLPSEKKSKIRVCIKCRTRRRKEAGVLRVSRHNTSKVLGKFQIPEYFVSTYLQEIRIRKPSEGKLSNACGVEKRDPSL